MKTIKNVKTAEVKRVTDADAQKQVATKKWQYCPKSEYKNLTK